MRQLYGGDGERGQIGISVLLLVAGLALGPVLSAATGCGTVRAEPVSADRNAGVGGRSAGGPCASPEVRKIVEYVNQERRARNIPPVECSDKVSRVARHHAEDMCSKRYMGHTSPDGTTMADRFRAYQVSYTAIGENVAFGQETAYRAHQSWMESRGHRKNVLNPAFRRIGVAVKRCGGRNFWAQEFASPPRRAGRSRSSTCPR